MSIEDRLALAREELSARLSAEIRPERRAMLSRSDLAKIVDAAVQAYLVRHKIDANPLARRDLVTDIIQTLVTSKDQEESKSRSTHQPAVEAALAKIMPDIARHIDSGGATELARPELESRLSRLVPSLLAELRIQLNAAEQRELIESLTAELIGFGPIDQLLVDETVSNIIVYGPKEASVERRGKAERIYIGFRDEQHLMNIYGRIARRIGAPLDETHPIASGRLLDGSQVKIMIPPLTIGGPVISIRKVSRQQITLDTMVANGSISSAMATMLKIAVRCRLNILLSGRAGAGKTTLLNALAQAIEDSERIVTIEEAAELQLAQPHVLRLSPYGIKTASDILRDAMPWQRDRILVSECRGPEFLDFFGGEEGTMGTIRANSPSDALCQLEWMAGTISASHLTPERIASAIDLICHIERLPDGERRVTRITEVIGGFLAGRHHSEAWVQRNEFETQDLFTFQYTGTGTDDRMRGVFRPCGNRPAFLPRTVLYGLDRALLEVI
jgi:pilus assembly protein CpaF